MRRCWSVFEGSKEVKEEIRVDLGLREKLEEGDE